jgi:hypothetical protein
VSSNESTLSGPPELYIVTTDAAYEQVGFVSSNDSSSAPDGAVTTGFTFFGTSVAYVDASSAYQLMFWAEETNTTDFYKLMWNANNQVEPNSVPVTLKSVAPVDLGPVVPT